MAIVFVNNPGDLSDQDRLTLIDKLVDELEHFPESWGPKSTNYFARDFLSFEQQESMDLVEDPDNEDQNTTETASIRKRNFSTEMLKKFLEWPEFKYWRGFLSFKKNEK